MAGSCTVTKTILQTNAQNVIWEIQFDWTSDGSGDVSGVGESMPLHGILSGAWFYPGTATSQPSDAYDVTLLDDHGRDVLYGVGANKSHDPEDGGNYRVPVNQDGYTPILRGDTLTPAISNAGDTKSGTIILQLR